MTDKDSVAGGAATFYLVAIQVTSRLLTFIGNQFLLRYVSPALLGLAVQLELLSVTILYSSRESLRVALQRNPMIGPVGTTTSTTNPGAKTPQTTQLQEAINMSYLVIMIGILNSVMIGFAYLRKSTDEVLQATDFWPAFSCYAAATLIELCAEPFFVVIQQRSLYKARAKAETTAAISKCLIACLAAVSMAKYWGYTSVQSFALGQTFYAIMLIGSYQRAVAPVLHASELKLLPQRLSRPGKTDVANGYWLGYFSKPLSALTLTFYAQSIFKLFLTEGDRWILSFVADLSAQGAFALASNYGGLLSRLLFQPVEESSRNIFGRLLASSLESSSNTDKSDNTSITRQDNTQKALLKEQPKSSAEAITNTDRALNHLSTTLRFYLLFSFLILSLLPHLFPILISTLIGARWSSQTTTDLLSAYVYYLPFLAINGILDAFVTSAATPKQLTRQSIVMMFVTLIYGLTAWTLMADPHSILLQSTIDSTVNNYYVLNWRQILAMGPVGLVWANVVNMTMRIGYSIWFISTWIKQHSPGSSTSKSVWLNSLPHIASIVTTICVAIGLSLTLSTGHDTREKRFLGIKGLDQADLGAFIAAGLVLGSSMLFFEYDFLSSNLLDILPERIAMKVSRHLPRAKRTKV